MTLVSNYASSIQLSRGASETTLEATLSVSVFKKRFGSWNEAVEAAGFSPNTRGRNRTPSEELLEELRRVAEDLGRPPSIPEMNERGGYSGYTYQDRFGSWKDAIETAGLDPEESPGGGRKKQYSDEELLGDIRTVAEEVQDTPTLQQYMEMGSFSTATIHNRFGSWNEALDEAGLESKRYGGEISEEDLIHELNTLADEVEGKPEAEDMDEIGAFHSGTYRERFGSWEEALKAAEIDN